MVVISEDFSRDQSYVETYRYSTYFLPSLELALRILCILEPLFMFGAFEKILEYSKPWKWDVSVRVLPMR